MCLARAFDVTRYGQLLDSATQKNGTKPRKPNNRYQSKKGSKKGKTNPCLG